MNSYLLRCLGVLLPVFSAIQAFSTHAAPGDEHWSPQFGWPGTTVLVHSIARHNNRLYVGGETTSTNTTVEVWDGVQWSTIGQFFGNNPVVYDLAWAGNTLYAAGYFTNVNGAAIKGLARWDGAGWTDMGCSGNAYALLVDGTNLYVGGAFTNVAGVTATNIARWNGSAWFPLGDGLGISGGNFILSLATVNGLIYAGGTFTNSGSLAATNLAQWNGSSWAGVGGGVGTATFPERVYALAVKDADVYAAGIFSVAGTIAANGIARWDGANWSALGSGISGGNPLSLTTFSNLLYVGGSFTSAGGVNATNFAVWNGASWSAAGNGVSSVAYRVLGNVTNVYVGGFFLRAGSNLVNQIASWDGQAWSPIGPRDRIGGLSSTARAITGEGTNLFVSGDFAYAGPTSASRIARYDGTNWSAFGAGLNSSANSLALVGTNLYVGGGFSTAGGYHVLRWAGTNWASLNNVAFATVNALAASSNNLFVAGYFIITASDGSASWLTRWDGTNFWKVLAFDENTFIAFYIDGVGFTAMAVQETNIYLSGHFSITPCDPTWTDCTNCQNVMRFDGTYGRNLGTGLNSNATSIAIIGTNVYFAGPFTNAGGIPANSIARWDGRNWFDVGGGVVGRGVVSSLAVVGTNLCASGTFTNMGGIAASRLAKWNGNSWSPLGSSTRFGSSSGPVQTLYTAGPDLFVGGTFTTAGGKPSYYLARWNEEQNFDVGSLWLSQPAGGSGGTFQFTVTAAGVPTYVIDRSANLTSWTPLLTNTITPYDCVDSNAPTSRQFYRARSLP